MSFDSKLVAKGKGVSLVGLLDQAKASAGIAATHAATLARFGFSATHLAQFAPLITQLGTERAASIEARASAAQNTLTEREALSAVKKFKTLLLSASDELAIDGAMTETDRDALNAGGKLGRSTAKHSAYLASIRKIVENHSTALAPFLDGANALDQLDATKRDLDAAQTKQELGEQSIPDDTQKIYEEKGRLLLLIERLNRTAARAFHGDAATKAKFNKDLILRATLSKRKPEAAQQ